MTYKKTKKSKKLLVGLLVALVVVAGYAYHSQTTKAHELVTSDNILDVLAEKFAELLLKTSDRFDSLAGDAKNALLGGASHFGIVASDFALIGETSTTTKGLYTFYRSDEITGSEDSGRWFNDTVSDVFLTDFKIITNSGANATGTFYIHASTSSRPAFFDYTASPHPYISGANSADNVSSSTRLFFYRYATSTIPSVLSATTTKQTLAPLSNAGGLNYRVGRNEFLIVQLFAQTGNCSAQGAAGGAAGNKGKCEEATSTNTGIKPITWFAEFVATTTQAARR